MALFNNNQKPKSFNIAPVVNFGTPTPQIKPVVSFTPVPSIGQAFKTPAIKPIVTQTKPQQSYVGSGNVVKSNNQSVVPNMTMKPVYQGPANPNIMSVVPKTPQMSFVPKTPQMSFVPKTPQKKNPVVKDNTTSNNYTTSYNNDNISYGNYNFDVGNKKVSSALPLGEAMAGSDYGDIGNLYRTYMSGGDIVDTSSIRSRAIADVQDRINALNQVYDQQLSRVRQEGVGRTGETTAALAARGLAGSMRGSSIADLTRTQNRQLEAQVDAERNSAIQGILSDANKAAMQEIQSKTEARLGGASALISFLKGSDERKQNYVNSVAQNLLSSGVDIQNLTPEQMTQLSDAAQKAGVSMNNIIAAYNDAAYKSRTSGQFDLSKGAARYDAQGNLIAQNAEVGGGEMSPEVLALAKQVNEGTVSIQQVPSALRGAVALAQQSMSNPRINELDSVISTIDELAANPKLKNILGPIDQAIGGVFGQAATAKNLYNQLTGILALEGRNKLKGSGAISDFEFKILKDAQSALGRNLNEEEFKKQLNKVRDVLEKRKQTLMQGTTVSGTSSGGGTFAEAW
jgi:hypothetical protein